MGEGRRSALMKFKYAQRRVARLKRRLEPTLSSVVIEWPAQPPAREKDAREVEALERGIIAQPVQSGGI